MIGRQATGTKIRLLTEQTLLATGIVRRHVDPSTVCPLCRKAMETLEHFLFECSELLEDREDAQEAYKILIDRNLPAKQLIWEAGEKQSLVINYVYKARIRKEILADVYIHTNES